jgi:hypothetical protein
VLRGASLVLSGIAVAVGAVCEPASADDWGPAEVQLADDWGETAHAAGPARFEIWSGAQAFSRAWSLYTGVAVAPFGGIQEDGLRLRAVAGYGAYSYSGPRAVGESSQTFEFHGRTAFADLLAGYHTQLGPLTLKAFGGLTLSQNVIDPDDPETLIRGSGVGGKAVLEAWWTISEQAWASVDVAWGTLYDTYAARARVGWRFTPALSAGPEAGAVGNVECDIARFGGFLRYEWPSGEVSISGGISNDRLLADGLGASHFNLTQSSVPFATVSWLARF